MRLTVEVTNPELDALEDVLTVWNLCPRHTLPHSTTRQRVLWQNECPRCSKILLAKVDKSLALWSRLCRAYDLPRSTSVSTAKRRD